MAAQNTTTHNVEVTDNGSTANVIKNIETLIKSLKAAQQQASTTFTASTTAPTGASRTAAPTPGGTAGSRATAQGMMSGSAYGTLRATGAGTGAAARDFAKESQGLGGLVRLYATYAANVFAVSAAFNALSRAMDTTNMIRGLDQLGANSGRSLGALSKRVVELTDGAVSLQEAMTAVAQSSSAGLSGKNIERLAGVAKNASLALGISMPDALNRLSRGITKLEPELLDELGIFTKIDPAVDAYSRQLNKAASQLTDFERRQAFANAVLKEGEDKFSSLAELSSNPYDRLLASLKNLAQETLAVVNKVLGPFIELLSSSPTLLATAVGGLGLALLRQAVPAIGQFKEELRSSADFAADLATQKAADAEVARSKISALIEREAERRADIQVQAVEDAEARMNELRRKGYAKDSATAKALAKDLDKVNARDYAKMEKEAKAYADKGLHVEAEAVRDVSYALQQSQKAEHELRIEKAKNIVALENEKTGRTQFALTLEAADKAQIESTKRKIVSDAAYNTSLIGMTHSWKLLKADIDASGLALTKFDRAMLMLRGSAGIAIGVLTSLGAALNAALGWIGLIITAFSLLDAVLSKNAKEMSAFDKAVDQSDDSLKNMIRTLEVLAKKGSFTGASIEGISALANAVGEANDTLEKLIATSEKAKDSLADSRWARIKDFFASLVGGGVKNNFAEGIAKQVTGSLQIFERAGIGEQAQEKLKKALGVTSLDFKTVEEAAKSLDKEGLQRLQKTTNELSTELNNSASRLQSFKASSDTALKSYQDFLRSTASTNPLFKLGANIEALGEEMAKLKKEGVDELQAGLIELATNPKKAGLFSQEFFDQLKLAKQGFLDQVKTVELYKDSLSRVQGDMAKLKKLLPENYDFMNDPSKFSVGTANMLSGRQGAVEELKKLAKQEADLKIAIQIPQDKAEQIEKLWSKGINDALIKGADYIKKALGEASERASITIARAQSIALSGAGQARFETRLNQRELAIQLRLVDSNIDLILQGERNAAATEALTAALALDTASRGGVTGKELDTLRKAAQATTIISNKLGTSNKDKSSFETPAGLEPDVERQVRAALSRAYNSIAEQLATKTEIRSKIVAETFVGGVKERKGELDDAQRRENVELGINTALIQRSQILQSIVGYATKESVIAESILEFANNNAKRKQEIAKIDLDIVNAVKMQNDEERRNEIIKLAGLKITTLQRQEADKQLEDQKTIGREIEAQLDSRNRNLEVLKAERELDNDRIINSRLEIINAENSAYAVLFENSKEYINSLQNQNELQKINRDFINKKAEEEQKFTNKLVAVRLILSKLDETTDAEAITEITKELEKQSKLSQIAIDRLEVEKRQREDILQITKQQQKTQLELEKINKRIELEKSSTDLRNTIANNALQLERARFEVVKALANQNDQYVIREAYALDLKEAQLNITRQIAAIETDLNNKRILSQTKINAEIVRGAAEEDVVGLQKGENLALAQQGQKATNEISALQSGLQLRTQTLELQKQQALEQAVYNQLILDANNLSMSLKDTFGLFNDKLKTVGESLGTIGTILAESAVRQQKFDKQQLLDQEKLNKAKQRTIELESIGEDDEGSLAASKKEEQALENKIAKDRQKNTREELTDNTRLAANAKKLFGEKTAAYKAFAAVEKAVAIAKVALDIQKMISDAAATNSSVANSNIRAAAQVGEAEVSGTAAVLKTMSSVPFPANIIAATLVAAAVGTLLSKIGGKSPSVTGASDNTGTGTTLGNATKPSETLTQSIEVLSESDPILMRNSSNMLRHLRSIDYNIANLGAALAKSLGGVDIATGKIGVQTGTRQSAIQQLLGGGGAIGVASGALTGAAIGSLLGPVGTVIGGVVGGLAGAIGALKTQINVQSQGIEVTNQSIQQIRQQGFQGRYYADVEQKTKLFGATINSSRSRQYAPLEAELKRTFELIFTNLGDAIISSSEVLGENTQEITNKVNSFVVELGSIPLQGLDDEQQQARLESVFGAGLDKFVKETLPKIADFEQVGEGLGNTLARVVYGIESATVGLDILGIQAIKYTDIINKQGDVGGELVRQSILATETQTLIKRVIENADGSAQDILDLYTQLDTLRDKLIDLGISEGFLTEKVIIAAGGTDKFSDALDKLYDNFTTDTYKLQIETAKATAVFEKYGLTIPKTRQGFFDLYQTLTTSSPEAAGALLKVLESIEALYVGADKIANERKNLEDKLAEATLTNLELREREIEKIEEANRVYQRQVWAYQDVQAAAKAYQTSLSNTIKTFTTQITTLKDYKNSLTSGANTTLTATEQYASAKSEMESLTAIIKNKDTTEANRNTAVGKLSGVTDRFLGLSRQLYASGAQYSVDFQTVSDTVDSVIGGLETQKTTAELQLSTLETSEKYLEKIADSSKSTADLLKDYNTAKTAVGTANAAVVDQSRTGGKTGGTTVGTTDPQPTPKATPAHAGGWYLDDIAGWVYIYDISKRDETISAARRALQTANTGALSNATTALGAANVSVNTAATKAANTGGVLNTAAGTLNTTNDALKTNINTANTNNTVNNQNMINALDTLSEKFEEGFTKLTEAINNNTDATVVVTTQVGENQVNATNQAATTQANTLRSTTSAYANMKRDGSGLTAEL